MGDNKGWLRSRKRHQILIAKIQRIAGGSLIAALIVGPLIYFSVVAMPLEMRDDNKRAKEELMGDYGATPDVDTELRISSTPIPLPKEDSKMTKILLKSKKKDLQLEPTEDKFIAQVQEPMQTTAGDLTEEKEQKFESFFGDQDAQMKQLDFQGAEPEDMKAKRENNVLIIEDVFLEEGPAKIEKKDDAEKVADKALQQYLRSELKLTDFRIFKDTSTLDKNKKPYQFVLSTTKQNNGKWYVTYSQYANALPVFDGDIKLIFTNEKKLVAISDNIKRDLPAETEFKIGKAVVEQNVKEIFEWDDSIDKIDFVDKGYYEGKPAYRAETNAHDPLGDWEIYVDGVEGTVGSMTADIRLQDEPATPEPEISPEPEITVEPDATPDPATEPEATPESGATSEPEIQIIDTIFSQILGRIYPQTPSDELTTEPLANSYAYTGELQNITDAEGYFENPSMAWYSTFLDGPYVTVRDDDATSEMEIVNQTPGLPFTWAEDSASLAAINAFYHTNKIHDYFAENIGYEIGKNIPLTVNSQLVDAYIDGCGAWFNNTEKTIEMGRGGTPSCPSDLNYALGSDLVYHEYAHFMVEDVTHLPYILGSETAAMSEGLSDYFAATINNDPMWGDVISPANRRNLENTLNYQTDLTGQSHHDGMILSGALWDLRTAIGQEATDKLVFNTLFQDRYHFETFMYGMIIEDDDNGDFSDGTPHLAEIITAFENHGVGPGIGGFNGLPLTPEAWAELLGEEILEGEEEELLGGYTGAGCFYTAPNLTVDNGGCAVYNAQIFTDVTVTNDGNLFVGYAGYSTGANTLSIGDDLVVQSGGTVTVGESGGGGYSSRISFTSAGAIMSIAGTVTVVESDTLAHDITGTTVANEPITTIASTGRLNIYDTTYSNLASLTVTGGRVDVGGRVGFIPPFTYCDGSLNVDGTTTLSNSAILNIGVLSGSTGSIFTSNGLNVSSVTGNTASTVDNDGTLNVQGALDIGNSSTLANSYRFLQSSGYTALIDGGADITNTTTSTTYDFQIDSPLTISGGAGTTITNDSGAYIDFNGTVTSNGTITNSSTAYFDAASTLGLSSPGIINNSGTFTVAGATSMNTGSTLSNLANGTANLNGQVSMTGNADLNNATGRTINIGNAVGEGLTMSDTSTTDNNGTINIYDDLIMASDVGGSAVYNNNSGASTNIAGASATTNSAQVFYDSSIVNAGTFDVNYAAATTTDGFVQIYGNSFITNTGTFQASVVYLGNVGGAVAGGTINNNSPGTFKTSSSTNGLDIYSAIFYNNTGATFTTKVSTNEGAVQLNGISADMGRFHNYGAATGRFIINPFGYIYVYNGGTYTANNGVIYGSDSATRAVGAGLLYVASGGTVTFTNTNTSVPALTIGEVSTASGYEPGEVWNYGIITGNRLDIFENTTYPNTYYEVSNYATTGFMNFDAINLGTGTGRPGGELYNIAGDGSPYGIDGANEGIRGLTNIFNGGNIYNGNNRTGSGPNYPNAEYNYESSLSKLTTLYAGALVENYGYFGGSSIKTDNTAAIKMFQNNNTGKVDIGTIEVYGWGIFNNGVASLNFDGQTNNFALNSTLTGQTSGATAIIAGIVDDGTTGNLKLRSVSGTFQDNEEIRDGMTTPGLAYVNGTITSNSGATVEASSQIIASGSSGTYNNSGGTETPLLKVGLSAWNGGILNLNDSSTGNETFSVTSMATDATLVQYGGVINATTGLNNSDADTFTVTGRLNVGTGSASAVNVASNSGTISLGEMYVTEYGTVNINGNTVNLTNTGGNTGDLSISGSTELNGGKVVIANVTDDPKLGVTGTTTINAYGTLENNAHRNLMLGDASFLAQGLVTVASGGKIISDETSNFRFYNGITSAGTVEADDNIGADNNSTTEYAIEVTGGTFTIGLPTNTGGTGQATSVGDTDVDVMISGGTFNTYNASYFNDFTVTGSSSVANFEDSTSPVLCSTDIHGYFDILDGATAEINCSNTNDAVYVHSGSLGGETTVQGTLILNTNLETETMVVGDDVSESGLVTHDIADSTWDPETTFVLTVTDTLTVNSNGALDVSEKSIIRDEDPLKETDGRGGSYGGMGQHVDPTTSNPPYGNAATFRLAYDAQTQDFTLGQPLIGQTSGARAKIMADEDNGTTGILTLKPLWGIFQDNEVIVSTLGNGRAAADGVASRADFGQRGHSHEWDQPTMGGPYVYRGGLGGGTMTINVGEDSDSDGFMNSGTINILSNGLIMSNGQDWTDGAGSGGSITIKTYTLTGSGVIAAIGGDATGSGVDDEQTAGGGGRIYIEYENNSVSYDDIIARGGSNTDGYYAGTGTILHRWIDQWQNQNDGTLIIDAGLGYDLVDVDLDSNTVTTDVWDATEMVDPLDIESVQIDRYAGFEVPRNATMYTQQCIAANNGILYIDPTATLYYNRDHGLRERTYCAETPDPPITLHINDSITGSQGGEVGSKTDTPPGVIDLTPATSAVYQEGALDRTGLTIGTLSGTDMYQILIGSSVYNVWKDIAIGTFQECNIDEVVINPEITHGNRTLDLIIPDTCGDYLSSGNTYYWKIRFREDPDTGPIPTLDNELWGLWSDTNHFTVDEGGIISVGTCSAGTKSIDLGNTPGGLSAAVINLPTDNFDVEACIINLESTHEVGIYAAKDQTLTHTNTVNTIPDMLNTDTDLDGLTFTPGGTDTSETGFHIAGFLLGTPLVVQTDGANGNLFNIGWHQLVTSSSAGLKILYSLDPLVGESFSFRFGAYILNDTMAGVYSTGATGATLTLTDNGLL
ncbi:hypothetical protein C0416_01620 [bacterium]|nr:hypothetical protein [bacterium]